MTQITRYQRAWACWLALLTHGAIAPRAMAIGNNFETAQAIELNHRYEGSLPVSQGRHCYRVNVPSGAKVSVRGSNNYESVFVSAYTGQGQLLVGETQILSSFKTDGALETEETDGSVMVCVDSDTAQRRQDHRYSLEVAVVGGVPLATVAPRATAVRTVASRTVTASPSRTVAQLPVVAARYAQPKARKIDGGDYTLSPYATSALLVSANARAFERGRDGDDRGDAGNSFTTARAVVPNQMYSGYLNARHTDDRDCYVYSDLPNGSRLKLAVANNDGILGVSAYSEEGRILIGQTYMVNQQSVLQTEETSGNVMVCMDTDGEKSDHQYTFNAQVR
jgi:hypothetical protein